MCLGKKEQTTVRHSGRHRVVNKRYGTPPKIFKAIITKKVEGSKSKGVPSSDEKSACYEIMILSFALIEKKEKRNEIWMYIFNECVYGEFRGAAKSPGRFSLRK